MTGFYLRVNGSWLPLDGVQSGVNISSQRASSEIVSVGGVRHVQYAPRVARTWDMDFGYATPEAVAAIELAAADQSGEVWLWDEAAARQNMLPQSALGNPRNPIVTVAGLPLRSLTTGPSTITETVSVPAAAAMSVRLNNSTYRQSLVGTSRDSLARFNLPPTPAGMVLLSAKLKFSATDVPASGGVEAFVTSGAWVPPTASIDSAPGLWAATRAGASLGTGTVSAVGDQSVNLSDLSAFAGGVLNIRVARTSGSSASLQMRNIQLELTYALSGTQPDVVIDFRTRPVPVRFSFTTNAPEGHIWGHLSIDGGGEIALPAAGGTGLRRLTYDLPAHDGTFRLRIPDSVYLLAGLSVSTLQIDGYYAPQNACVKVAIDDPTLTLDRLLDGKQGQGNRTVTIREVGS